MEIKKDIRNDLLRRQEISLVVEGDKNPGFVEIRKKLSEEFKKSEDNIDVYNVIGKFGRDSFLVKAYIYDIKEDLIKNKNLYKTKKQKKAEEDEKKKEKEEADKLKAESETKSE